jgi:hypothetical protein
VTDPEERGRHKARWRLDAGGQLPCGLRDEYGSVARRLCVSHFRSLFQPFSLPHPLSSERSRRRRWCTCCFC